MPLNPPRPVRITHRPDSRAAREVQQQTFSGVRVYVGQTRSAKLVARLQSLGVGEMTVRGEYPPRRHPWVLDNGAFKDWGSGKGFDEGGFMYAVHAAAQSAAHPNPDFIVIPDVVADARRTIALAQVWIPRLHAAYGMLDADGHRIRPTPPLAFVVQDGMTLADVLPFVGVVQVLFVGGTVKWKWQTAAQWCDFAHAHGLRCHIGRVGTPKLVAQAVAAGADSIDSAYPLWKTAHLDEFMAALVRAEGDGARGRRAAGHPQLF